MRAGPSRCVRHSHGAPWRNITSGGQGAGPLQLPDEGCRRGGGESRASSSEGSSRGGSQCPAANTTGPWGMHFFCKGPDSKCFQLFGPYNLSCNYSALRLRHKSSRRRYVMSWHGCWPIKLFMDRNFKFHMILMSHKIFFFCLFPQSFKKCKNHS